MMMQIFMPYPDLNINTKVLDETTLGRQCNAITAILDMFNGDNLSRFMWNPAIKMWAGNEAFLAHYGYRLFTEWKSLGYPDHWTERLREMKYVKTPSLPQVPWWWGHEGFHDYNKVSLFRENPDWYGQFFTDLDHNAMGYWPNPHDQKFMRGPKKLVGNFMIENHPVFDGVRMMQDEDFIRHANAYHRLTPDMAGGVRENEQPELLRLLRTLHDRFHVQRVYISHDHR